MPKSLIEEQLNQKFTQVYISSSLDSISVVDRNIRVQYTTDSFAKLCGFKRASDFTGLSGYEMNCAAAENAIEFERQFREVIKSKRAMRILDICTYTDNNLQLYANIKLPVYDNEGNVVGACLQRYDTSTNYQVAAIRLLKALEKFYCGNVCNVSLEVISTYEQLSLTPCESLSFYFYIRGYTFKEIARYLGRSPRTVEEHINNVKCKVGTSSRASLIEYAVSLRLFHLVPEAILNV